MDSAKFFKLMGDSGLAGGKTMSRTDCDLIFTKTCSTSGCVKKIHYDAFRKVYIYRHHTYGSGTELEPRPPTPTRARAPSGIEVHTFRTN